MLPPQHQRQHQPLHCWPSNVGDHDDADGSGLVVVMVLLLPLLRRGWHGAPILSALLHVLLP